MQLNCIKTDNFGFMLEQPFHVYVYCIFVTTQTHLVDVKIQKRNCFDIYFYLCFNLVINVIYVEAT